MRPTRWQPLFRVRSTRWQTVYTLKLTENKKMTLRILWQRAQIFKAKTLVSTCNSSILRYPDVRIARYASCNVVFINFILFVAELCTKTLLWVYAHISNPPTS